MGSILLAVFIKSFIFGFRSRLVLKCLMHLQIHKEFIWRQYIVKLCLEKVSLVKHWFLYFWVFKYISICTCWHMPILRFCQWHSSSPCKATYLHEFEWWICKQLNTSLLLYYKSLLFSAYEWCYLDSISKQDVSEWKLIF